MSQWKKSVFCKLRCLHFVRHKSTRRIINQEDKRGSMLQNLLENRDKRKNWHFEILQNHIKARNVFEKISIPKRRQNILNSLFIKNITDVLSTGDIAPELMCYNFEITGVKVSPCCRTVNVYWETPTSVSSTENTTEDIAILLSTIAPKIRAELISRNVLGRVPKIFFVRDATNFYTAAFEKAMKEIDLGPQNERSIIPDDSFAENIYKFNDSKADKEKSSTKVAERPNIEKKDNNFPPERPSDMKMDVFGLKHNILLSKVIAAKSKPVSKHVITTPDWMEDVDLFSKIPGTPFHEECDRKEILKQFHLQRKLLRNKKQPKESNNIDSDFCDSNVDIDESEPYIQDFIEEETTERF